jgi:hypothetical protein
MAACWPLQMPPTAKSVLISLADNASDHGFCWPSISTIAKRTCFGRTAVMASIAWLEEKGALKADRSNGRHTTYVITPQSFDQSDCRTGPLEQPVRQPNSTSPSAELHRSSSRTAPVRQVDSNHQEPSRTAKSKRQGTQEDFQTWPTAPTARIFSDWCSMRAKKRAPVTHTVIEAMGKQLHAAAALGWTVDGCLAECVLRNWQGLNADWLTPRGSAHGSPTRELQSKYGQAIQRLEAMKSGKDLSAADRIKASIDARDATHALETAEDRRAAPQ